MRGGPGPLVSAERRWLHRTGRLHSRPSSCPTVVWHLLVGACWLALARTCAARLGSPPDSTLGPGYRTVAAEPFVHVQSEGSPFPPDVLNEKIQSEEILQ